jgi:hypothetical protein
MFKMDDEHLSILSQKEKLGYSFESYIQQLLWLKFRIPFNGNPLSPLLWKHCIGTSTDIDTNNLALELKFVQYRVYPCHVLNHVIPRFDGVVGKRKIVLTNNKALWTNEAISVLSDYDIELWDINDLVNYYSVPSFISVYNFVRRDVGGTTLYNAIRGYNNVRKNNAITNKENTVSNYAENSATIGENSSKSGKEKRKSMDSIDVSPDKAQAKPKESPKESFIEAKVNRRRTCFRCGKQFTKGSGYLCSNCIGLDDKDKVLWHCSIKSKLSKSGIPPICNACKETIEVLSSIIVIRQRKYYYHKKCYDSLIGIDDNEPKETLSYTYITANGKKINTFEVV